MPKSISESQAQITHLLTAPEPARGRLSEQDGIWHSLRFVHFGPRYPLRCQYSQVGKKFFVRLPVHCLAKRNEIWHNDRHCSVAGSKRLCSSRGLKVFESGYLAHFLLKRDKIWQRQLTSYSTLIRKIWWTLVQGSCDTMRRHASALHWCTCSEHVSELWNAVQISRSNVS